MAQRLKAALFDLDGTLIDTEGQYTLFWEQAGRRYRPDVPDLALRIKGTTLTEIFSTFFPSPEVQEELRRGLTQWEASMEYRLYPGTLSLLRSLREGGIRTVLVTSSDRSKLDALHLHEPRLLPLFDTVLTAEDFTASKPAPDCYLLAARMAEASPGECIAFEDAPTGLQAAMSAGVFTFCHSTTLSPEAARGLSHHVLAGLEGLSLERLEEIWREGRPLDAPSPQCP